MKRDEKYIGDRKVEKKLKKKSCFDLFVCLFFLFPLFLFYFSLFFYIIIEIVQYAFSPLIIFQNCILALY